MIMRRPVGRMWLLGSFAALVVVSVIAHLLPGLFDTVAGTSSPDEFGSSSIATRLRYLTLESGDRIFYWLLPWGILPGLSVLFWRKMDRLSRELVLVSWLYTIFFMVQAYRIFPHHFAPVIIISLLVFWRTVANEQSLKWLAVPGLVGAAFGFGLSFPPTWDVNTSGRDLAAQIGWHTDYQELSFDQKLSLAIPLTTQAFALDYAKTSGLDAFVVSPLALAAYAALVGSASAPDYLLKPVGSKPVTKFPITLFSNETTQPVARAHQQFLTDSGPKDVVRSIGNKFYLVPRWEIFGDQSKDPRNVIDWVKLIGLR